jgi:DNA polymerase III delta prime subunit
VQNALLKVLEQSPSYAKIFLITESVDVFLKTILSRIFVHTLESSDDLRQLAEKVLKMESYLRLQDSKLKKLLAAKVENVNQAYGAATPQEDMDEEGEDEASGKKRQDRSKHVQLFTVLIQIVLDSWRGGNAQLTNDYISGLNDLSVSIHQHGGKPLLALEYLLLTCPKL